jgi:hypothetical protein
MNARHLFIASLLGGLVSTALVNTPFVNLINLLVCAGFWIGPIVAVWLYRRLAGAPALGQALVIGLLAGAWHGLFGLLLSPFGLAGASGLLSGMRAILPAEDLAGVESALTGLGALLFNLIGVAVDLVFGLVGGLIGAVFFGARRVTA